jgi:hypothetical protein
MPYKKLWASKRARWEDPDSEEDTDEGDEYTRAQFTEIKATLALICDKIGVKRPTVMNGGKALGAEAPCRPETV